MSYILADNITSPLGQTTAENVESVLSDATGLRRYDRLWGLPTPFVASLFSERQREMIESKAASIENRADAGTEAAQRKTEAAPLTFFEAVATASVAQALESLAPADAERVRTARTAFILSTTKGNVEQLADGGEMTLPSESAARIASCFDGKMGKEVQCVVVCNACISGLSALILADRLLASGEAEVAVVCGVDVQSDFIVAGFQSLKALSDAPCRPFDIERLGLNLGEAAATAVLAALPPEGAANAWEIRAGAMSNDAYHISAPSKKGEGLQQVLRRLLRETSPEDVALVNAHGTATMFNDQMEGIALRETQLSGVPVGALKGYFGHTMGAAGVLETVLTMHTTARGILPATRGFSELGVSARLDVSATPKRVEKAQFIKQISGFGGCNAGVLCRLASFEETAAEKEKRTAEKAPTFNAVRSVSITPSGASIDGVALQTTSHGAELLTELYKTHVGDYPKFYKMDRLCRLGFVASELLLSAEGEARFRHGERRGVVLFCRHSTTDTDRRFYASITPRDAFFPSPSVFVYTLPNILTGEIAIRNGLRGETCLYLLDGRDDKTMRRIVETHLAGGALDSAVCGWVDFADDNAFEAHLQLITH